MPELDVLAVLGLAPAQDRSVSSANQSMPVAHGPDAGLVDPAAQVRRRRDVGAAGDHPRRGLRAPRAQVGEQPAERLPGWRAACGGAWPSAAGIAGGGSASTGHAAQLLAAGSRTARLGACPAANRCHGSRGSTPQLGRQLLHLRRGEQRGVVVRVSLGRQPRALIV